MLRIVKGAHQVQRIEVAQTDKNSAPITHYAFGYHMQFEDVV